MTPHETWCGIHCDHEDCGACTCPRMARGATHPHYDLPREERMERSEVRCRRCGSSHTCSPFVSIWNTRTASSGNFDTANGRGVDTSHAKCEDTGWSEFDRRVVGWFLVSLIFIATVVYIGARYGS